MAGATIPTCVAFSPQNHKGSQKMRVPHDSAVLIADGRKSLFFRNEGDGEFPNLQVQGKEIHENPAHHEQATDTAGQAMNVVGSHGGTMTEVDFHQQEEDRFAADTAGMLNSGALSGAFEALIVVAPPKTLGELRKHYHKELEKRLVAEIPKDLVNMPVAEIERILKDA
jgi:protein required for attachment to host cells